MIHYEERTGNQPEWMEKPLQLAGRTEDNDASGKDRGGEEPVVRFEPRDARDAVDR
jgi:hypothetical protein